MNKNWNASIITSIICRLLGLVTILAFVFAMVVFTGSLHCLWLLWLLFAVELVPTYEFKREFPIDKEKNNGN
jgi:hypothetical protein